MNKENIKQNFFSKTYGCLENAYFNFSNWLTKKGIPLNTWNNYLDKKGIPVFPVIGSIILIIILLLLFLFVFHAGSTSTVTFKLQDSYGQIISNANVSILDSSGNVIFSGIINNNDSKKLKLKVNDSYDIEATKDGYSNYSESQTIFTKDQLIKITFDEVVENGILKIQVIDSDNLKIISLATATISYELNGTTVTDTQNTDASDNYNITFQIPKNKDIDLTVSGDKYQDFTQKIKLNNDTENKIVKLVVNNEALEGQSKVTFVVTDTQGNMLDDAQVDVYNSAKQHIGSDKTINGRVLFTIPSGETISFRVSKDEFKTYVNDDNVSYKILNLNQTIPIILEAGGNKLDVKVIDKDTFMTLDEAIVSVYNLSNNLIDTNITLMDGVVHFKGLENNSTVIVSACKDTFFCEVQKVDLSKVKEVNLKLEKIKIINSAMLDVFVVDTKNLPIDNVKVNIFIADTNENYLPYDDVLVTDATGSVSIPLKINHDFRVTIQVGDYTDYRYITISGISSNKLIFEVDSSNKELTLDLYDMNKNPLNIGHLLVKAKDGTVLFDKDLNGSDVFFDTKGYSDLIYKYTDMNGNPNTGTIDARTADSYGNIKLNIGKKSVEGNYPIINFVGVQNVSGKMVPFITTNQDYYLVYNVVFPKGSTNGSVHIRAGDDTQVDSENMSYGITGFIADTTSFRYSTTYNPQPIPGSQSVDVSNLGTAGNINKWLELNWNGKDLGSKQIKIKIKANDLAISKLNFEYRAWIKKDNLVYRDPVDDVLKTQISSNQKQTLYAKTKNNSVELYESPANCNSGLCASYEFIDFNGIHKSRDDFFAVKNNIYALEINLFSYNNTDVNLSVDTSNTQPIISFISVENNFVIPSNINTNTISNLSASLPKISLQAGHSKKVYIFFIAKNVGVSYIDLKLNSKNNINIQDKFTFDIKEKRDLTVILNPSLIVPYDSILNLQVSDSLEGTPIENALIKIKDQYGRIVTTIKGNNLNGKNGNYNININFVLNKFEISVSSYGYTPYTNNMFVADNAVLDGPSEIIINMGIDQITETTSFNLKNIGTGTITDVHLGDIIWIEKADNLILDLKGPTDILKNTEKQYYLSASILKDAEFKEASGKLPIYGMIGNRQVVRVVPFRVIKGLINSDCIIVQPKVINTYVGMNTKYNPAETDYYDSQFTDYKYNNNNNNYDYGNSGLLRNGVYSSYNNVPQNYNNPINYNNFSYSNSTNYNSYNDYLNNNYSYNGAQTNPNVKNYTDGFYKFLSSKYTSSKNYSENTVVFNIENKCEKAVILNPQLIVEKSNSNNDLEISLTQMVIQPGENKLYSIDIKNAKARKQAKTYKYNIIWKNSYYSLQPTELNVKLLDLSKALWATPQLIYVPMSQVNPQLQAIASTRFMVKNIGNVPITDIQISRYPNFRATTMGVTEYPREIQVLEPGKMIPIDLKFQVNTKYRTLDNMYFLVTGKAAGVSNPIIAYLQVVFVISSANCLQVTPKKLSYNLKIGDTRSRRVTITNKCAEPVSIMGIDKRNSLYLQTFGNNPVNFYPIFGGSTIPVNGTGNYSLDITAINFGGSPSMPLHILGKTQSNNWVSSTDMLVSLNIQSKDADIRNDEKQANSTEIPICDSNSNETKDAKMPIVAYDTCTGDNGYCDAYGVSNLILKKIDALSSEVSQVVAQAQSKVSNTGCSLQDARMGFCPISDIGGNIEPLEFTVYMQNDAVTTDLLRNILESSKYKFKNYSVDVNPTNSLPQTGYGVYEIGNVIHLSDKLRGCGRYKLEINGFVAATYNQIDSERMYYYVNVLDYNKTAQCKKEITNYLNFLPWDTRLYKNKSYGSWLTLFAGDKNISEGVISSISKFNKKDNRYISSPSAYSHNNKLYITAGPITENPIALAKIYFKDSTTNLKELTPEQINIVINNRYTYDKSKTKLPDKVIKDAASVISSFINKNEYAKVCISEDNDYMLILKLINAGVLKFKTPEKYSEIKNHQVCTMLSIKSGIDESLSITSEKIPDLDITFKETKDSQDINSLILNVVKNKDSNFFVCYKPLVPETYKFVGKNLVVNARSIYAGSGKVGQRTAVETIHLTSCGVTPLSLLKSINEKITSTTDKSKISGSMLYALVDWNKSYNPEDKENICDTINKFVTSNPNSEFFFAYAKQLNCKSKELSNIEKSSKRNKAFHNAGTYFGACMISCGGCSVGMDALFAAASAGLSFGKAIKDVLLDCGVFACGMPAIGMYVDETTGGGVAKAIDEFIGKWVTGPLRGNQNPRVVRAISDNLSGLASKIGSALAGVTKGARMNKTTSYVYGKVSVMPDKIETVTIPGGGAAGAAGAAGAGEVAGAVLKKPVAYSSAKYIDSFDKYIKVISSKIYKKGEVLIDNTRYFGTHIENTAMTFDNIAARTGMTDEQILRLFKNKKVISGVGYTAKVNYSEISTKNLEKLLNLVENSTFKHAGNFPNGLEKQSTVINRFKGKSGFYTRLKNYESSISGKVGSTGGKAGVTSGTQDIKILSPKDRVVQIESYDKQIKALESDVKGLNDKIANRTTEGRAKWLKKKIGFRSNEKRIEEFKKLKKAAEERLTATKSVKSALENAEEIKLPSGSKAFKLSDDLASDMRKLPVDDIKYLKKVGPWTKTMKFTGGLIKGIGCGILGNYAGNNMLKQTAKVNVSNAVSILKPITFFKNTFYQISIDSENSTQLNQNRLDLDISKYIGSQIIPDDLRLDSCSK